MRLQLTILKKTRQIQLIYLAEMVTWLIGYKTWSCALKSQVRSSKMLGVWKLLIRRGLFLIIVLEKSSGPRHRWNYFRYLFKIFLFVFSSSLFERLLYLLFSSFRMSSFGFRNLGWSIKVMRESLWLKKELSLFILNCELGLISSIDNILLIY